MIAKNTMILRSAAVLAAAAMVAATTGCSLFGSSTQRLQVATEPPGARVYVNGQDMGTSPVDIRIKRREDAQVTVRKKGYMPTTRSTTKEYSTWGAIDITAGVFLLFPFLGIAGDAAYVQTPKNMLVYLSPVDESLQ